MIKALWRYRGFVLGSVRREYKERYQRSMLGKFWIILNPLAMILVYTVVFAEIMQTRMPGQANNAFAYSIYLCSGILPWGLFSDMFGRLQTVFISNSNLLKKASFPRISLPIIVAFSCLLNFGVMILLFCAFLVLARSFPGMALLSVLPIVLLQVVFVLGLGVLVGTLNVFFRDIGQLFGIVLQFWFWLTPVVYTPAILSENLQAVVAHNPMALIIQAYQRIFVEARAPEWATLAPVLLEAIVLSGLALVLFRKVSGELVDEL